MELGPGNTFWLKIEKKTKRFIIFDRKKMGVIFFDIFHPPPPTPHKHPPLPHLPRNLKKMGFKWRGGGSMVGSDRLNVPAIDNSSH